MKSALTAFAATVFFPYLVSAGSLTVLPPVPDATLHWGILSPDGTAVFAHDVNGGASAWRWRDGDAWRSLVLPEGRSRMGLSAVSADGSAVLGRWRDEEERIHAVLWKDENDSLPVDFGVLRPESTTWPVGITRDGVTLTLLVGARPMVALYQWSHEGGLVELLGAPAGATVVSGDGRVIAGYDHSGTPHDHTPWRWTLDGEYTDLGALPGYDPEVSGAEVLAISADGTTIVGVHAVLSGAAGTEHYEAFRWTAAEGMLPLTSDPIAWSAADLVSGDGRTVLISAHDSANWGTWIWDSSRGLRPLREALLTEHEIDMSGWSSLSVYGLSDDGLAILGKGIEPGGQERFWIARLPEPTTGCLCMAGGVVLLLRRRTGRIPTGGSPRALGNRGSRP